jgi:hypothetical protein
MKRLPLRPSRLFFAIFAVKGFSAENPSTPPDARTTGNGVAGMRPAHIFLHFAKFCEILSLQTSTLYLPSASSATVCFTLKNHPSLNAFGRTP